MLLFMSLQWSLDEGYGYLRKQQDRKGILGPGEGEKRQNRHPSKKLLCCEKRKLQTTQEGPTTSRLPEATL